MSIALACPSCKARMEYQDADAGRSGQCPTCRHSIQIPLHLKTCTACRRQVAAELTSCPACAAPLGATAGAPPVPIFEANAPDGGKSGKALWSLILGIASPLFLCITGVPAIILGALALGDIRRAAGRLRGQGMATTGIVLGSVGSIMVGCVPVLIALLLPAVQMSREAARRTQCRNNLRQIGVALQTYHDEWGSFPPRHTVDASGAPQFSWRVLLLPHLGEQELYEEFNFDEPWDSPHNLGLSSLIPDVYQCPSEVGMPHTTAYVAITGEGTVFPFEGSVSMKDVIDGLSNTVMVGEIQGSSIVWTKPEDVVLKASPPIGFSSSHPGGWQVLFADGSVKFISGSIDDVSYRAMMTIAGREAENVLDR